MAKSENSRKMPDYNQIRGQIRDGKISSLYVFYGEEDFLIRKLVTGLTEALIDPGSESLDRVLIDQAGASDLGRVSAEVMTPPFLSKRKLVIVKKPGYLTRSGVGDDGAKTKSDTQQDDLVKLIEKIPDSACLVICEEKVDRRMKKLVKLVEERGVLAEIGRQQPRTLQQWILAEGRRRGAEIEPAAADSLVDRCDMSMQVIWLELQKLFLYLDYTQTKTVDPALIAEISLPDLRGNIFNLTDALSDGQTDKALQLVDTLIGQKQPVQLISFMLTRHIRQLICAAELGRPDQITKTLKVMPFVGQRLAKQARRFNLGVLERLYQRCFESDMLVKTGQLGDRMALELLLIFASETAKADTVRPAAR